MFTNHETALLNDLLDMVGEVHLRINSVECIPQNADTPIWFPSVASAWGYCLAKKGCIPNKKQFEIKE